MRIFIFNPYLATNNVKYPIGYNAAAGVYDFFFIKIIKLKFKALADISFLIRFLVLNIVNTWWALRVTGSNSIAGVFDFFISKPIELKWKT